jgi:hypothetical protein
MKTARPLPLWLKWVMRLFGVLLIVNTLGGIAILSYFLWMLGHSKEGLMARSGAVLGELVGGLVTDLLLCWLGVWLVRRSLRKPAAAADTTGSLESAPGQTAAVTFTSSPRVSNKHWRVCNILRAGPEPARLWQFEAARATLIREHNGVAGLPLPPNLRGKTVRTLWQPTLNVAWLPPENVFVRVAHFPVGAPEETRAMVELQLEKLSPIPVTQAVWTLHTLPHTAGSLQTVLVVIASRNAVEEFLGRLEGQGFLADRLELPMLDQLQATPIQAEGAWIYPEALGGPNTALVAWWYGGVLQTVDLITLPPGPDRAASLRDQLTQMAWAGELEGWLTAPPRWHLVAENEKATEWEPPLRAGLDQRIELVAPLPMVMIASLTAKRAVHADIRTNLLPPEFAARYQQQFVDRLWMRGVGAAVGLYVAGLVVYFVALMVLGYKTHGVEADVTAQGPAYTNALQLTQQYRILKERQDLKYAGLDCWEAVAECQPENVQLDQFNFSDGKALKLGGSAPSTQIKDVIDFVDKLHKHRDAHKPDQLLFDPIKGDALQTHPGPNGLVIWGFGLELKRTEQR